MKSWEDYRLFIAVVENGGLSAAGRILGMSPAKLSKRILYMEQQLGARLLNRTTRRVSTTLVGQQFYEDAIGILSAVDQAEQRVRGDRSSPGGPLRVTAPTSLGRLNIVPHIPQFLKDHPAVDLEIDLSDEFVDMMDGKFDLAVRIATEGQPGLTMHRLMSNHRILCAAPAYLAKQGVPSALEDLNHHRILATTAQLPWRLQSPDGLVTFASRSAVRTNSSEVVRELAVGGVGIALRSTWDVSGELDAGALVRVLPTLRGASGTAIYAVHPGSGSMSLNVQAFVDFLGDVFNP